MFLSVEWAKRWLPAVFLLLSLFLPWWTFVSGYRELHGYMSFPWSAKGAFFQGITSIRMDFVIPYNQIPYMFFVSSSIVLAGLCGLIDKSRVRTIGGLLGIVGVISYFVLVFPKSIGVFYRPRWEGKSYFGTFYDSYDIRTGQTFYYTDIWFLSAGFYLALAGSIMLLLPLIRTLIERIKKRLSSPEQTNEEPI